MGVPGEQSSCAQRRVTTDTKRDRLYSIVHRGGLQQILLEFSTITHRGGLQHILLEFSTITHRGGLQQILLDCRVQHYF